MGSQQLFCLRWSNHQSNMLSVFDQLLQSEALVDVTLACEGLSLRAHKVVLSACSPYFQSLFIENPCKHPIVILKDIKFTDMKALVDFMYKGEVNVTQEQLSALLKTAETLKVKGLAEMTGGATAASNAHPLSNALPPIVPLPGSSIPPHPALQQIPTGSTSPPSKRKKARLRKHSPELSPQSDMEDGDSLDIRGSPEVIETKVEVPSEAFVPERPADQDSQTDNLSDLPKEPIPETMDDSSSTAFRNSTPGTTNANLATSHSGPATPTTPILPPPPPQPPTLPVTLPSTSGTQSTSQGLKPVEYILNDPYWLDRPPPKLAIALARKCIFGDEILKQSNLTSRNNMKPLDHEKLELIKKCVRWVYNMQSEEEFELTWAKCKTAIQQKCKHLRYYPTKKTEHRDTLSEFITLDDHLLDNSVLSPRSLDS